MQTQIALVRRELFFVQVDGKILYVFFQMALNVISEEREILIFRVPNK